MSKIKQGKASRKGSSKISKQGGKVSSSSTTKMEVGRNEEFGQANNVGKAHKTYKSSPRAGARLPQGGSVVSEGSKSMFKARRKYESLVQRDKSDAQQPPGEEDRKGNKTDQARQRFNGSSGAPAKYPRGVTDVVPERLKDNLQEEAQHKDDIHAYIANPVHSSRLQKKLEKPRNRPGS